jgi:hypothetical protein
MIPVTDRIVIDEDEIEVTLVRPGGSGGQTIDNVATARFSAAHSRSLYEAKRAPIAPVRRKADDRRRRGRPSTAKSRTLSRKTDISCA